MTRQERKGIKFAQRSKARLISLNGSERLFLNEEMPYIPLAAEKYAPTFRALLSTKIIHKSETRKTRLFYSRNTRALFFERIRGDCFETEFIER